MERDDILALIQNDPETLPLILLSHSQGVQEEEGRVL